MNGKKIMLGRVMSTEDRAASSTVATDGLCTYLVMSDILL